MNYLSICSGIEAATVAWHHMGWQPAGFAEIEKFPAQVLAHHYPNVRNYGDLTKHDTWGIEAGSVDLLVGGTPCQAFSVAGLRRGMEDERGQLTLEFVRLAARLRPRWIVWENVPGVLSSAGGRDFGSFLGALGELGYGWAYRILDAQYFGVAQRRRRVFVVGYLGDWRRAAAVLFERESVRWDPPPSREARKDAAGCLGSRASSGGGFSTDFERAGGLQVVGAPDCRIGAQRAQNAANGHLLPAVATTLSSRDYKGPSCGRDGVVGNPIPVVQPVAFKESQSGCRLGPVHATLDSNKGSRRMEGVMMAMAVPLDLRNAKRDPDKHDAVNRQGVGVAKDGDPAHTVTSACVHGVATAMRVRRLTPVECERLQGFPDGYTDIKLRGKDTPDGPRYKALGNSMAVPVMRWIGERIEAVDKLSR
jgi:DNA (cytosine-5)-methyltransferase 1